MSTFVDLDSIWRDRITYPNPCDYVVTADKVQTWGQMSRSVMALPQNQNIRPLDFVNAVTVVALVLPYNTTLTGYPCVYVNMCCQEYKDEYLINTIGGILPRARFKCFFDKIQNNSSGDPTWIHYKCTMEQVMRYKRNSPVTLQITSRDGTILPFFDESVNPDYQDNEIDPTQQSLITFCVTPYIRDGSYTNQTIEPIM
jgi:hypothetical protein